MEALASLIYLKACGGRQLIFGMQKW